MLRYLTDTGGEGGEGCGDQGGGGGRMEGRGVVRRGSL